jgi:hypothetical protein
MAAAPVALPFLLLAALAAAVASATTVAYNDRAVVIDGQRRILLSGSIHYPRSTPQVSEIDPSPSVVSINLACHTACLQCMHHLSIESFLAGCDN